MLYELTNLAQKAFTAMENTYTVVSNMAAQSLYGTNNPGRASTFRQGTAASNMSAVTAAVPGGVPVSDDGRAEGGGVASGDLMLVFSSDANMHSVTVVGADGTNSAILTHPVTNTNVSVLLTGDGRRGIVAGHIKIPEQIAVRVAGSTTGTLKSAYLSFK